MIFRDFAFSDFCINLEPDSDSPTKGDCRDFQDFEGSIGLGDYRDFGGVYRVENETKQS